MMSSSHRLAHRFALRALIAPRPVPRHDRRGGVLASPTVPSMSARRDIIRHRFPSNHSSPRLLAPSPPVHQSRERLRLSASDCGNGCCGSYLLGYQSAPSFRSHPPRPIDTGNGENDGAGFLVLDAVIRFACPFDCVGYGMATAIAFIVWVLLIACPPSYDCRAIPRRSMRVVIRSGLDQARSFPRLLRIQCGLV